MNYVGLDVHQKQSTFCVLDEHGRERFTRTVKGGWDRLLVALAEAPRPFAVGFEASLGYGALADRLGKLAERVVVAHPGQLRLIFRSKRKNDRVDAQKLAKLLFLGETPTVHVPSLDVRAWRGLIAHRQRLVERRVRTKNQPRALLRAHGVTAPKSLWTQAGRQWLSQVELPTPSDALRRDLALSELTLLLGQVRRVEEELNRIAAGHPGVARLRTIPGVGPRTAEAVVAHLDDPRRFRSARQVGSYFGLVPCQDASADRNRLGHLTKQGPSVVRRLLVEAAWQGIRRSPTIRACFERLQHGDPLRKKIALVGTAHYLARVMFALLTKNEAWRESAAA
jgi:transposase